MQDVTQIREPNFGLDLPGEWEPTESVDEGTMVFRQAGGSARTSVTLLGVRPLFAIADQRRLLEDYMSHRSRFEEWRAPALKQSQLLAQDVCDVFDGVWSGEDPIAGRLVRHRVLLVGGLLADFAYEATGVDEAAFAKQADVVLGSATATL